MIDQASSLRALVAARAPVSARPLLVLGARGSTGAAAVAAGLRTALAARGPAGWRVQELSAGTAGARAAAAYPPGLCVLVATAAPADVLSAYAACKALAEIPVPPRVGVGIAAAAGAGLVAAGRIVATVREFLGLRIDVLGRLPESPAATEFEALARTLGPGAQTTDEPIAPAASAAPAPSPTVLAAEAC